MVIVNIILVETVQSHIHPSAGACERRSPKEAQSGRVSMYAIQNERTALSFK